MRVHVHFFAEFIVLISFGFVFSGELKEVEFIPEEELLGSSLKFNHNNGQRQRRNYRYREVLGVGVDQDPSGSELLGPGIDIESAELSKGQLEREKLEEYQAGGQHDSGNARGEIGFYGNSGQKGESGHLSEGAYIGSRAASHKDRADAGYYGNQEGLSKGHNVGRVYGHSQEQNHKGVLGAAIGSKGGHRKGHHSSGFHKSYHKDESANNTSFYDDANDSGEHYYFDAKDNYFNDHAADAQKGNYHDRAYQDKVLKNQGGYGISNGYDTEQGHKGNYGQDKYYNDNINYGHKQLGENYGKVRQSAIEEEGDKIYKQNSGVYRDRHENQYKSPSYTPVSKHYSINKGRDYYPVGDYSHSYSGTALSELPYNNKVRPYSELSDADTTPHTGSYYGVYRGIAY